MSILRRLKVERRSPSGRGETVGVDGCLDSCGCRAGLGEEKNYAGVTGPCFGGVLAGMAEEWWARAGQERAG